MGIKDKFSSMSKNTMAGINTMGRGLSKMRYTPGILPKAIIGTGILTTVGMKSMSFAKNRIDSSLQTIYPENMLPTMQGRFGKRVDGLSQSPTQGVKFNFRRK